MATIGLSTDLGTGAALDIGAMWQSAIQIYEETVSTKIGSLTRASNVEEILSEIHQRQAKFKTHRHDGSRMDKTRRLVSKSMEPIQKISGLVATVTSTSFPPSTAIFTAVSCLITTATSISADYDKVEELFEELGSYLSRLKILENEVSHIPEVQIALVQVLRSVLILCGICTKYTKQKRIVKAFRNLFLGADSDLTSALAKFHKSIDQEQAAVQNATLARTERTERKVDVIFKGTESMSSRLKEQDAESERENILSRLSSTDFLDKQRAQFEKLHHGTGLWFLEKDEFRQWHHGDHNSVLWCPGIRKSVITSMVINHVDEAARQDHSALAYIYCDYKDPSTHSAANLLSSIVRQLAAQSRPLPPVVKEFCEDNANKRRNPSSEEYIAIARKVCLLFKATYIFIDAMDEYPETTREAFLSILQIMEPFVRLFITSRPNLDLRTTFTKTTRLDIAATDCDIETYVDSHMMTGNMSTLIASDSTLKNFIMKSMSSRVKGMFLVAYLQLTYLGSCASIRDIRMAMDAMPEELSGFYQEAMKRIANRPEPARQLARKALSYVFCARRPLSVEELRHALATSAGDSDFDETALPDKKILLEICTGLLRIDDKTNSIDLVHSTLQEFFEKNRRWLLPEPDFEFAKSCLTYLLFETFASGPCKDGNSLCQRVDEYRLLKYASHHWGHHIVRAQRMQNLDTIFTLLENSSKSMSSLQVLYVPSSKRKNWFECFPKRSSSLHVAAFWGLDEVMVTLLDNGEQVNALDSFGMTALHLAAKNGHYRVVQFLLESSAQVDIRNSSGETPLYWASRNSHNTVVDLLLAAKASLDIKDNEGWTALDWAVANANNGILKSLLADGAQIYNEWEEDNKALYLAAEGGNEPILQTLLAHGIDVNVQDNVGSTALDFAVSKGDYKSTSLLLKNGANVNSKDHHGNTALHWATLHEGLLELFLSDGTYVNAKNRNGQTPFCWAAQDGTVQVAKLILDHGGIINDQDVFGYTALHRAVSRGREIMVRMLLDRGADPNTKDRHQWTPLHIAVLRRDTTLIELLLDRTERGGTILHSMSTCIKDKKQRYQLLEMADNKEEANSVLTGLRWAIQERQFGRLRILLENGLDANGVDVGGWTALLIAAAHGHDDGVQLLLENGADVNFRGRAQKTALHWACEHGNTSTVQILLENGANVDADAYGWKPILLAAKGNYMAIVCNLIREGAHVDAEDYHGRRVLHWIAQHHSEEVVPWLVEKGVDLNAVDDSGKTALMWAVKHDSPGIVKLLLAMHVKVDTRATDGSTALHWAVYKMNRTLICFLLEGGASTQAALQGDITALHIAAAMGDVVVVALLLERGADMNAKIRWYKNSDRCCEDDDMSTEGLNDSMDKAEAECLSSLLRDILLNHKEDMAATLDGLSARQLAERNGHSAVLRLLDRQ